MRAHWRRLHGPALAVVLIAAMIAGLAQLRWSGWPAFAALFPAALTFCALYATALRIRLDRAFIVAFLAGPVVGALYYGLVLAVTDPTGPWDWLLQIWAAGLVLIG